MAAEQRVTVTIGRSGKCDIVMSESSMSRIHAEVTLTHTGRVFVVDRLSSQGTYVAKGDDLVQVRQTFAGPDDIVFFGELGLSGDELRECVERREAPDQGGRGPRKGGDGDQAKPRRRPEWDPESGEILERNGS